MANHDSQLQLLSMMVKEMSNSKKDRRPLKRFVNHLKKKAGYGKYVIDCRHHPCLVVGIDFFKSNIYCDGIEVKSLFNDSYCGCSLRHCGIEPISKAEAFERADFRKSHTFNEYLMKYCGYTEEGIEEFNKLDEVWNFNKGD